MKSRVLFVFCLILTALLIASTSSSFAGLGSLKDKVKKKVEKKTEEKADEKLDKAADKAAGDNQGEAGEAGSSGEAAESGGGAGMKPGEGVWVNYDFIPGDRVVYFEDFSKTGVGDFPQRLQFVEGNMEVAEWRNQRWLRATNDAKFEIPLSENLPQRFTLEFDYYGPASANTISIFDGTDQQEQNHQLTFFWYLGCGVGRRGDFAASMEVPARAKEKVAHCRVMGDGKYLKVYVNETRVANIPNSTFGRSNSLPVQIWAEEEAPLMITNLRIAAGGKKIMYDQLMAEGKVVTQGILFASGSDEIKPESTPTLKEIGAMLKDHADLKLSIEGHTDNVGDDAGNQTLSNNRAASVKAYLIEKYGIDAARLETKGFGETKPVDSNDTPEGRQNNRRVELIKL
ncbi:MAG: OmpA family protein [candidate division Zixibacteria bacterium]|nr:OmpA family protein [candidate division Zixibacteria bacterium]